MDSAHVEAQPAPAEAESTESRPLSKSKQKRLRKQVVSELGFRVLMQRLQAEREAGREAWLEKRKEKVARRLC